MAYLTPVLALPHVLEILGVNGHWQDDLPQVVVSSFWFWRMSRLMNKVGGNLGVVRTSDTSIQFDSKPTATIR